jgi:CheY-like chemotaxis protein
MEKEIRILFVEDNEDDVVLLTWHLRRAGIRCVVRRVDTESDFARELRHAAPDLILSNFSLPQFDGMQALNLARTIDADIPFIFVSGIVGEERAVERAIAGVRNGAVDYVLKDSPQLLAPAVLRAMQDTPGLRTHEA